MQSGALRRSGAQVTRADDDAERLRAMRTKGEEWRYD
jgi:hypothetical protein